MKKFWVGVARFALKRAAADSNLVRYAQSELGHDDEDTLSVVRAFTMAGHSGTSASVTNWVLERLLRFQPLSHLNGTPDEWNDVTEGRLEPEKGGKLFQNRRCSTVFKEVNAFGRERAYDIDGKVFVYPDGCRTTRGGDHTPVTFPYFPGGEPEEVLVDEEGRPRISVEQAVGNDLAAEELVWRGAQAKLKEDAA